MYRLLIILCLFVSSNMFSASLSAAAPYLVNQNIECNQDVCAPSVCPPQVICGPQGHLAVCSRCPAGLQENADLKGLAEPPALDGPCGSCGPCGNGAPCGPCGPTGACGERGACGPSGAVGPQGQPGPIADRKAL